MAAIVVEISEKSRQKELPFWKKSKNQKSGWLDFRTHYFLPLIQILALNNNLGWSYIDFSEFSEIAFKVHSLYGNLKVP